MSASLASSWSSIQAATDSESATRRCYRGGRFPHSRVRSQGYTDRCASRSQGTLVGSETGWGRRTGKSRRTAPGMLV